MRTIDGAPAQINSVAAQAATVAVGCTDGTVLVYYKAGDDDGDEAVVHTLKCPDEVRCVSLSAAGRLCAGACRYNRPCAHQYVGKSRSCML